MCLEIDISKMFESIEKYKKGPILACDPMDPNGKVEERVGNYSFKITQGSSMEEGFKAQLCLDLDKLAYCEAWVRDPGLTNITQSYSEICPASGDRISGKDISPTKSEDDELLSFDRSIEAYISCSSSEKEWDFFSLGDSGSAGPSPSNSNERMAGRTSSLNASYQYHLTPTISESWEKLGHQRGMMDNETSPEIIYKYQARDTRETDSGNIRSIRLDGYIPVLGDNGLEYLEMWELEECPEDDFGYIGERSSSSGSSGDKANQIGSSDHWDNTECQTVKKLGGEFGDVLPAGEDKWVDSSDTFKQSKRKWEEPHRDSAHQPPDKERSEYIYEGTHSLSDEVVERKHENKIQKLANFFSRRIPGESKSADDKQSDEVFSTTDRVFAKSAKKGIGSEECFETIGPSKFTCRKSDKSVSLALNDEQESNQAERAFYNKEKGTCSEYYFSDTKMVDPNKLALSHDSGFLQNMNSRRTKPVPTVARKTRHTKEDAPNSIKNVPLYEEEKFENQEIYETEMKEEILDVHEYRKQDASDFHHIRSLSPSLTGFFEGDANETRMAKLPFTHRDGFEVIKEKITSQELSAEVELVAMPVQDISTSDPASSQQSFVSTFQWKASSTNTNDISQKSTVKISPRRPANVLPTNTRPNETADLNRGPEFVGEQSVQFERQIDEKVLGFYEQPQTFNHMLSPDEENQRTAHLSIGETAPLEELQEIQTKVDKVDPLIENGGGVGSVSEEYYYGSHYFDLMPGNKSASSQSNEAKPDNISSEKNELLTGIAKRIVGNVMTSIAGGSLAGIDYSSTTQNSRGKVNVNFGINNELGFENGPLRTSFEDNQTCGEISLTCASGEKEAKVKVIRGDTPELSPRDISDYLTASEDSGEEEIYSDTFHSFNNTNEKPHFVNKEFIVGNGGSSNSSGSETSLNATEPGKYVTVAPLPGNDSAERKNAAPDGHSTKICEKFKSEVDDAPCIKPSMTRGKPQITGNRKKGQENQDLKVSSSENLLVRIQEQDVPVKYYEISHELISGAESATFEPELVTKDLYAGVNGSNLDTGLHVQDEDTGRTNIHDSEGPGVVCHRPDYIQERKTVRFEGEMINTGDECKSGAFEGIIPRDKYLSVTQVYSRRHADQDHASSAGLRGGNLQCEFVESHLGFLQSAPVKVDQNGAGSSPLGGNRHRTADVPCEGPTGKAVEKKEDKVTVFFTVADAPENNE